MKRQIILTIALRLNFLQSSRIAKSGLQLLNVAVARQRGHVDEGASDTGVIRLQKIALENVRARWTHAPVWVQHTEQQGTQGLGGSVRNVDYAVAHRVPLLAVFGRGGLLNEFQKGDASRKDVAVGARFVVEKLACKIYAVAFLVVPG